MDRILFYCAIGKSFSSLKWSEDLIDPEFRDRAYRQKRVGWAVGGGIEYAVTNNITVKSEYIRTDYGKRLRNMPGDFGDGTPPHIAMQTHRFRVGVNYLFGLGQ